MGCNFNIMAKAAVATSGVTGGSGVAADGIARIFSTAANCAGVAFAKRNSRSIGITSLISIPGKHLIPTGTS